jgi:Fe-S oxidoreductase
MPGGCRRRRRARCSTSRIATTCRSSATRATRSDAEAVFYFPGCGSERLFSQVGLATQAMLWHVGVQTVLPPGLSVLRLSAARRGQFDQAEKIITDNRVLFHRVANTLNYLDIKTVVVSCGTCYDQLQGTSSRRSSRAAASSTSTSTCSTRACGSKA